MSNSIKNRLRTSTGIGRVFESMRQLPRPIPVLGLLALAAVWLAVWQQTRVDRDTTVEAARRDVESYAVAFEEFTRRNLQTIDRALRAMQQAYAANQKVDARRLVQAGLVPDDPAVVAYGWFDEQGFLVNSNLPTPTGVSSASRDWFPALKSTDADVLYLSRPQRGRQSGMIVIVAARRLVHTDGSFAGAVGISFKPDYLVNFNPSTRYRQTTLNVLGADGTYYARRVGDNYALPMEQKATLIADAARREASGILIGPSPADAVVRIGAWRTLSEFQLTVSVAQSMNDVLANYHGRRRMVVLVATLASVLIVALFSLLGAWVQKERNLREQKRESEAKSTFLATLAHELRNPMAAVRTTARVLTIAREGEKSVWAGEVIERQMVHVSRLLDDLLDVTRITRNRLELTRMPVSVDDLIDAAQEQVRDVLADTGQSLVVERAPTTLMVDGDRVRLVQVLGNLLHNAAKYSRGPGEVHVVVRQEKSQAVIAITDHGIGIAEEELPRIFGLFVQTPEGKQRAQGGLGIGLALVKGLVELHGGSVGVSSPGVGLGSTFEIRLPLLGIHAIGELPSTLPVRDVRPVGATRVLLVDDNRDAADSLALVLRDVGYVVRVAYNGEEFRRVNEEFLPDIVLLDIGLPDTTGYELAAKLRRSGRRPRLVAITGWGQEEDRAKAAEAGFDHHLTKPVSLDTLLPLLASMQRYSCTSPPR